MDDGAPRKATILIPPLTHPECAPRLIAWACFPDVKREYARRERLAHNLVAWWWLNCRANRQFNRQGVPRWAAGIVKRDKLRATEVVFERINQAVPVINAWGAVRIIRDRRKSGHARNMSLNSEFERIIKREQEERGLPEEVEHTTALEHFQERRWLPLRPMIHVLELLVHLLNEKTWQWRSRGADTPEQRALFEMVWNTNWVPQLLDRAENSRLHRNQAAGLDPASTYCFGLAENEQILGVQGDFISA